MFSLLICTAIGKLIDQRDSLYTETIPLSWIPEEHDLIIKIRKERPDPLLLLGGPSNVYFIEDNGTWNFQADAYDLESWALPGLIEHTFRINAYQFLLSSSWVIGIYLYEPLSYEITYGSSFSDECNAECSFHGECFRGYCDCSDNYRGNSCRINLNRFNLDQLYNVQHETVNWKYYTLYIPDGYEEIRMSWEQFTGDAFLFIDFTPTSTSELPSMFSFSQLAWLNGDNSESFAINDSTYWVFGVYCRPECQLSLSASSHRKTDSLKIWLILVMIFCISLVCVLIPVSIQLIFKFRKRPPVAPEILMNGLFPCKKYQPTTNDQQDTCMICLDDFDRSSQVRELRCRHVFHSKCIDSWVATRANCPLCKGGFYQEHTTQRNDIGLEEEELV